MPAAEVTSPTLYPFTTSRNFGSYTPLKDTVSPSELHHQLQLTYFPLNTMFLHAQLNNSCTAAHTTQSTICTVHRLPVKCSTLTVLTVQN
jgi:hypothetical protein